MEIAESESKVDLILKRMMTGDETWITYDNVE